MLYLNAIMLIIGGLLGCYGIIVKKVPDLKKEFDKIIPYQGFVGIVLIILGFLDLFNIIHTIKSLPSFGAIMQLLSFCTKLVLGFLLSFGLVAKYAFGYEEKKKSGRGRKKKNENKLQETSISLYSLLSTVQIPFGILGVIVGSIALILIIVFTVINGF